MTGKRHGEAVLDWEDLAAAGIAVPAHATVDDLKSALAFRKQAGSGVVCLKGITQEHKARLGLVELGLRTPADVEQAWGRLSRRCRELGLPVSLLVQEQVGPGPELIVGGRRDPVFGPLLILGWGGRLAEAVDRTEIRLAPVRRGEARAMTRRILGSRSDRVADLLVGVSGLLERHPELAELDLNPVILVGESPVAVDLRSLSGPLPRPASASPDASREIARILSPRSVAVIGASADRRKVGGRVLGNLLDAGSGVELHAVNPRGGSLQGLPAARSISELPKGVEVAVIATDASQVAGALEACGERGIEAAVVLSGGFAEAGNAAGERRLGSAARRAGIRFCGVNTIGVIGDVPLTFSQASEVEPVAGGVSFVTQSGALGGSLLVQSWLAGLGTARYVCVGNQTDLDMADYLSFMADDDRTGTVGVFLEGVRDGRRFRAALRRLAAAGKPVVVMRAGTSVVGQAAARSHTAVLAGSQRVYEEVLRDAGAILVDDLPELVGACQVLEWMPRSKGRRVAVISTSGGACSVLADLLSARGLEVPALEPEIRKRVAEVLPAFAPTRNPLDTTGQVTVDPGIFGRLAEVAADSRRIDCILVAVSTMMGAQADQLTGDVIRLRSRIDKPLVVGWALPEVAVSDQVARLRSERIPVFASFSIATRALAAAVGS